MSVLPPGGRGLWRLTLHTRPYVYGLRPFQTGLGELVGARSRRLEQAWNKPAKLTFTIDGDDQAAALIEELATEVVAYRYDSALGRDRLMFRGPIVQTEDQLTEQAHTINVACTDYLGMLGRRYLTALAPPPFAGVDQDTIVSTLLAWATTQAATVSGQSLMPGSFLPLTVTRCNPDGTIRAAGSGQLRDRTYTGGSEVLQLIDELSAVIAGFDYDVFPSVDGDPANPGYQAGTDVLRVFYPAQGTTRTDMAFIYGGTVSGLTRTLSSPDYGNYARVVGQSEPDAPQLVGESWNPDANNVTVADQGLWMLADNAADVSVQATLVQKAQGMVGLPDGSDYGFNGVLVPSYSLTMRPGAYVWGSPKMGDTVPLHVESGRLRVNTTVRVIAITWAMGDDTATEDVEITVGRPAVTLAELLTTNARDINALVRR